MSRTLVYVRYEQNVGLRVRYEQNVGLRAL
jgi:hypothetical protein